MMNMIYNIIISKKLYVEHQNITTRKSFLLCKSCFWCASLLYSRPFTDVCPTCVNSEIETMHISFDETYKFDYDASRGVTLEFIPNR
jgi:hypothetical protein